MPSFNTRRGSRVRPTMAAVGDAQAGQGAAVRCGGMWRGASSLLDREGLSLCGGDHEGEGSSRHGSWSYILAKEGVRRR